MLKNWLIACLLISSSMLTNAAIDVYEFDTETQRQRYQKFMQELRCPKCKNQNLAGTNSQIAIDLRRELHRLVVEGQSDEEIVDFMVTRYGDFVLYRPPVQGNTILLWTAPIVFLLLGAICIGWIVVRRRKIVNSSGDLSEEEKNQLASMLSTTDTPGKTNKK